MQKPYIGVVEDYDALRSAIVDALIQANRAALGFVGLDDFFERAAQCRPDIILCDVHLGDGDGFDLIDRLQSSAWEIPVILMSASGDLGIDRRAQEKGAIAYLRKPFGIAQLLQAIDRA